jgi:hypothetical protein
LEVLQDHEERSDGGSAFDPVPELLGQQQAGIGRKREVEDILRRQDRIAPGPERDQDGGERGDAVELVSGAPGDGETCRRGDAPGLVEQAALADAGRALDRTHAAAAAVDRGDHLGQETKLALTTSNG